jgi:hypothetical protein
MSETVTPWEFRVESEQGSKSDEQRRAGPRWAGDRGRGEGVAAAVHPRLEDSHDVHSGLAEQRVAARATVLTVAYAAHPEAQPDRSLDCLRQLDRGGVIALDGVHETLPRSASPMAALSVAMEKGFVTTGAPHSLARRSTSGSLNAVTITIGMVGSR